MQARFHTFLHIFGWSLSGVTFLLLFAGGMVTSTHSGLAVPDWPTTFGQNMFAFPPSLMKGGIFYEHGHRLIASLVGLLTIALCAFIWIWDSRRWLKTVSLLALILVIAQGVLGGLTVRYRLPMPVSTGHACMAQLFFAATLLMAFATSRAWLAASSRNFFTSLSGQWLTALFCAGAFLQIVIGAMMRHSYAGLAIPTFPLAFGEILPPFWNFGITLHFLHSRLGASALLIAGGMLIAKTLSSPRNPRGVKALAAGLGAALLLQCGLGMLTIWSGKGAVPATFHLSGGALVWALGFLLLLAEYRFRLPASVPGETPARATSSVRLQGAAA